MSTSRYFKNPIWTFIFFTFHTEVPDSFSVGNVHVSLRLYFNRATRGAIVERPVWFGRYNAQTPHRGRSGVNKPRPPTINPPINSPRRLQSVHWDVLSDVYFYFYKQLQAFLHCCFVKLYHVYLPANTVKIVLKFII